MKIIRVRASVGATVNLGNYESLRLEYAAEAEVGPDENPVLSIDILRDTLSTKIKGDLISTNGGRDILLKK